MHNTKARRFIFLFFWLEVFLNPTEQLELWNALGLLSQSQELSVKENHKDYGPSPESSCVCDWILTYLPSTGTSAKREAFLLPMRFRWALAASDLTSGPSSFREKTLCQTSSPWESPSATGTPCRVWSQPERWRRPLCLLEWSISIQWVCCSRVRNMKQRDFVIAIKIKRMFPWKPAGGVSSRPLKSLNLNLSQTQCRRLYL